MITRHYLKGNLSVYVDVTSRNSLGVLGKWFSGEDAFISQGVISQYYTTEVPRQKPIRTTQIDNPIRVSAKVINEARAAVGLPHLAPIKGDLQDFADALVTSYVMENTK